MVRWVEMGCLLLLAGCVPAVPESGPAETHRRTEPGHGPGDSVKDRAKSDERRPGVPDEVLRSGLLPQQAGTGNQPADTRPVDLSPVLAELRELRQSLRPAAYTGALVHVDAVPERCLPCRLLEQDLRRLASETKWRVGTDDGCHWKVVTHRAPTFPLPRIEFLRRGQLVDVWEGYPPAGHGPPALPARPGYSGPIDALVARHPAAR